MLAEANSAQNKNISEIPKQFAIKNVDEWLLKKFLDIIILNATKNNSVSGYDILLILDNDFDVRLSSGTVYSKLASLENNKLIVAHQKHGVRYYLLTNIGKETLNVISSLRENRLKKIANYIF